MMSSFDCLVRHSGKKILWVLIGIGLTVTRPNGLNAQTTQPAILDPQTLIDRCLDASGGKDKLRSIQSLQMRGTIQMPDQNLQGTLQIWLKPDRALILSELPGIGQIRSGIYDQVAYELSDITGARLLNQTEKKQLVDGLNPDNQFQRFRELRDPRVTGPETLGNRQVWQLSGTTPDGDIESHWIDTQTFYLLKSRVKLHHQMGKIPVEMTFDEYKSFDGIPFPQVVTQRAGPATLRMQMTDIVLNPTIDDSVFALPDEIKQLIEQSSKSSKKE